MSSPNRKLKPSLVALPLVLMLLGSIAYWSLSSNDPKKTTAREDDQAGPMVAFDAEGKSISADFEDWAAQYLTLAEGERDKFAAKGVELAQQRRSRMLELIQKDPKAALAAALPRNLHEQLPEAVTQHLEQYLSARAPLDVIQSCLHPEGVEHDHEHDFYRATLIDGREYVAHVYGSRLNDLTIPGTSIHGIALDGHLAVSESRVRVLEPGESLPPGTPSLTPGGLAVEANGKVSILASVNELKRFEESILAGEDNPNAYVYADDAGQGAINVTSRPSESWTTGDKKMIVIMVDFSDVPGTPLNSSDGSRALTETAVDNLINGTNGVAQFYRDSSFGKTDLVLRPPVNGDSPDVTEVLRMPQTAAYYATSGSTTTLGNNAKAAATTAGYDVNGYDRVCIMFTNLTSISGSKYSFGGRGSVGGKDLYINGFFDFRVIAHELGHNWGLRHANLWKVNDGNPGSLAGSSTAYGDTFDTMGAGVGDYKKHFSQWGKSLLWWLPDSAVPVAEDTGVYRVHRFDGIGANLSKPRALKIVRDDIRDYWIGYRRATTNTSLDNGAYVLWGYNTRKEGDLLDMNTPGTSINDAGLAINQTYEDVEKGIAFTPVAQGGSGADEWLDIDVVFQPRISWAATTLQANENGRYASLTVNRTRNSSGTVSIDYSTTPGTATSPGDFTATTGTLTWGDGDDDPKTILVPLVPDGVVESNESFTLNLSSPLGGLLEGAAIATVTIVDGGAGSTTTVPAVVGLAQAAAESALTSANLTVGTIETIMSETVPAGIVISQSMAAGLGALPNSPVDLLVSLGGAMATVPDLAGLTQASAESAITAAQLVVGTVATDYSATVPAGEVISQSLGAGTSVAVGSALDLVISLGAYNEPPVVNAGDDQQVVLFNASAPWTPADIVSTAWFDASDAGSITASNGAVTQWADKSGNGHNLSQGTSARRPTTGIATINGRNVLSCDGNDFLTADNFPVPASGDIAIFMMAQVTAVDNSADSIFSLNATKDFQLDAGNETQFNGRMNADSIGAIGDATGGPFSGPSVFNSNFDRAGSGIYNTFIDGTQRVANTTYSANLDTSQILGIFISRNLVDSPEGKVAEVIVTSDLSLETRQKTEGYLAHKWGQVAKLPAAHPYKTLAPGQSSADASLSGSITDADDAAPSAIWSMISGPAAVSFADETSTGTAVSFTTTGTYVLRLTATDGTNTVSDELTVTVRQPTVYENWTQEDFSRPFALNDPSEDPDKDGLNNLLEFAFGMNPTSADGASLAFVMDGELTRPGTPTLMDFAAQGSAADFRAVFSRRKDHVAANLLYTVEFSADLTQWTASATPPTILTAAGSSGTMEAVSLPFPATVPANGSSENLPPRFFRVGIEMP